MSQLTTHVHWYAWTVVALQRLCKGCFQRPQLCARQPVSGLLCVLRSLVSSQVSCVFLGLLRVFRSLVCFQVVQSMHSCLLYDTVSFLDEASFHRLLPMLVSQLAAQPPPAVATALTAQNAQSAAAPAADTAAGSDPFGQAVVAALVQMAVTANNDALWKSLNHQASACRFTARSMCCLDHGRGAVVQ